MFRNGVTRALVPLALISIVAGSRAGAQQTSATRLMSEAPRRETSNRTLTARDLAAAPGPTLEDAIRQLRPEFFRVNPPRAAVGRTEPVRAMVYVDNHYTGEPETLRTVPISAVIDVRYLSPSAAHDWFGPRCNCDGGAILVTTRGR